MADKIVALAQLAGSRFRMKLGDSSDYARGVGYYQRALRRDGGARFIIYPNMPMRERKSSFPNLPEEHLQTGVVTKYEKVFRANMPSNPDSYYGPSYYRKDGLMWVQPYYSTSRQKARKHVYPGVDLTFRKFCDKRFPKLSSDLIEFEIKAGLIAVNLQKCAGEDIIREGDVITRTAHFHEKPILDKELNIIYEDESMVVVDKPPSWPVHPCGSFRMGSLLYFLYKKIGYSKLRTIHRLDRLTSGVLLIAKNKHSAKHLANSLKSESTQKHYLALVHGHFPEQEFYHNSPLSTYKLTKTIEVNFHQTNEYISAETRFKFINYDERTDRSLVLCQPLTGRTHQIRLHLSELEHPIVYDTLYGSQNMVSFPTKELFVRPTIDNKTKKTAQCTTDQSDTISDTELLKSDTESNKSDGHRLGSSELNDDHSNNSNRKLDNLDRDHCERLELNEDDFIHDHDYKENTDIYRDNIESNLQYDPNCNFCNGSAQHDMYEPMYICLHSYRYIIADMEFTAGVPDWAKDILPEDFQLKSKYI